MENYITREDVLLHAIEDCYREMFAKAQPEADWDNLIAEYNAGKIDEKKDGPVYDRHYLSIEEYDYILNKYLAAYRINTEWDEDIEILEKYLKEGGSKDKYIDSYTDENGNYHSGYRGYEKVAPLKEQILDIMKEFDCSECAANVGEQIYNKVMETISDCKNFYNFDRDEMKFRNTLALGATPTSNKETVKKWWKEHYGVDIEIEDRVPKLFWYMDNGYTHQDLIEEFGENYDETLLKEWEDEKAAKKAEYEKKIKELHEKIENEITE